MIKFKRYRNCVGLVVINRHGNIFIGKIDIMKSFSFFEIDQEHESEIIRKLKLAGHKISLPVIKAKNEMDFLGAQLFPMLL